MSDTEEKPEKSENEEESPGEPAEAQDETGIDKDIKKLSVEDTKPEEEIGIVSLLWVIWIIDLKEFKV